MAKCIVPRCILLRVTQELLTYFNDHSHFFIPTEASKENWEELLQSMMDSGKGEEKNEDMAVAEQLL